jgi:hypothetical protein
MKQQSNYQDLLKVLALIIMLVDHIGLYIYPENIWLRIAGRFAMPIFAFYAGYNFKGKLRHMIWICGIVIVAAWKYSYGIIIPNILIDLAIGQLYLLYAGKSIMSNERKFLIHFISMLAISPITIYILDYGTITIAYMMIGFMIANRSEDQGHLLLATSVLMIFNLVRFEIDEIGNFIAMLFAISSSFFVLYRAPHKTTIALKVTLISRNMLYIYILSTLALIFINI